MRFSGGNSSFISERIPLSNLFTFTDDNTDFVHNKSQFGALNFGCDTSPKLSITGFVILSKTLTESQLITKNNYLQNSTITFENSYRNDNSHSILGIGNIKLDYSPNKNEKWFYNSQFQSDNNNLNNTLNSITNANTNLFETINNADNTSVKQYTEWYKSYNPHRTTTFVVNQTYEKSLVQNHWFTDKPFFTGLIPLEIDTHYSIEQIKKIKNNSVAALFKLYWIINNSNHIYTNIGNSFDATNFETNENQILTDGKVKSFDTSGFGNKTRYQLNDLYIGLEYKFRIGKWTNKTGLYWHWYQLQTNQMEGSNSFSKKIFQPQWNSNYEFNKSETLNLDYNLVTSFPEVNQLANRYSLQYYNLVYKGNALLENESYHTANLQYSKMNMYRGITWDGRLNFTQKGKTIRNEIKVDGIEQYYTPVLNYNPETNLRVNGSFSKKIYLFNLKLNVNLNWFDYSQTLNNKTSKNQNNSQNIGLRLKTSNKKWPDFSFGYSKGYSQFSGITKSTYQNEVINSDFETIFLNFGLINLNMKTLKTPIAINKVIILM